MSTRGSQSATVAAMATRKAAPVAPVVTDSSPSTRSSTQPSTRSSTQPSTQAGVARIEQDPDWKAGYVRIDARGKRTFYIRQRRGSKRHDVSTRASTLRAAMRELERWESDPDGYKPAGTEDVLTLTPALIARYVSWCHSDKPDARWLRAKELHLNWWAERLKGRDLSNVKLGQLLDILSGATDMEKRKVVIKHFYSFLRKTDRVGAADDPTLAALPVRASKPSQDTGESKVIYEADFQAVLPLLPQRAADMVRLMAGTGCHVSEVLRFALDGSVAGNVISIKHKGGHLHRVQVSDSVAEAARRLAALKKTPSREHLYRQIKSACRRASAESVAKGGPKISTWTPGRFRHTFATNAVARGVNPGAVALAMGHKSSATTLVWYATTAVAPMVGGLEEAKE